MERCRASSSCKGSADGTACRPQSGPVCCNKVGGCVSGLNHTAHGSFQLYYQMPHPLGPTAWRGEAQGQAWMCCSLFLSIRGWSGLLGIFHVNFSLSLPILEFSPPAVSFHYSPPPQRLYFPYNPGQKLLNFVLVIIIHQCGTLLAPCVLSGREPRFLPQQLPATQATTAPAGAEDLGEGRSKWKKCPECPKQAFDHLPCLAKGGEGEQKGQMGTSKLTG